MIVAVGHDLIEVERLRAKLQGREHHLRRLFTPGELEYCGRHLDPWPSLAARFAAKEAFQKVWPEPHGWRDVWVERPETPGGAFPYARPRLGFAPAIAEALGERHWVTHLSLTHTREHASAVVILEEHSSSRVASHP